ncbi:MAG: peptidoglycan-binding protein [Bacteroidetes bacterium]|nr:peptidoglycan-binding protein [Bacteroidota bacterium]
MTPFELPAFLQPVSPAFDIGPGDDAPPSPNDYAPAYAAVVPSGATFPLQQGSRGEAVRQSQEALNLLGHNAGTVDGIFGPNTAAAVARWCGSVGWTRFESLTENRYNALMAAAQSVRDRSTSGSNPGGASSPSWVGKVVVGAAVGLVAALLFASD